MSHKVQIKWITVTGVAIFVADQISKAIVIANLDPGTPFRSDTFFYFVHQRNSGLIGGSFANYPFVTYLAPLLATAILLYLSRHLDPNSRWQRIGYGMLLGGAFGNFVDRVRLHSVTDFLQFHFYFIPFDFPWKFYPAFNIADSGILVGVSILVFSWSGDLRDNVPSTP